MEDKPEETTEQMLERLASYRRMLAGTRELLEHIVELDANVSEAQWLLHRDRDDLTVVLTRAETIIMQYKKRAAQEMATLKGVIQNGRATPPGYQCQAELNGIKGLTQPR